MGRKSQKLVLVGISVFLIIILILSYQKGGQPSFTGDRMVGMPCHQMADGTWMGDCEGANSKSMMVIHTEKTFLPKEELIETLSLSKPMEMVELDEGETFSLSADIVRKQINGQEYIMYGYNQQVPGPFLKVKEGTTITVEFTNNIDLETTIHWHGLRHDNKDDGVPGVTQDPVKPGESYRYTVFFPDAGVYWYHPHVREDVQQDLGLAGNMLSFPEEGNFVNQEEVLILDDILIQDGMLVPYGKEEANFALMGRFGNVMLVNGETDYNLQVSKGSVVRFYITNVANVRPFNIDFNGAKMKLIGSDIGNYEHEEFIESVIISPAERYIVDVYFDEAKTYTIAHTNPKKKYSLGTIRVGNEQVENSYVSEFTTLRNKEETIKDIESFKKHFDKPVDYTIDLTVKMPMMDMGIISHVEEETKIEWEDPMPIMNQQMTTEEVTWILRDRESGKENMNLSIRAKVGDVLKIRLFNDPKSMHPMQHPIHIHGQRFLVLNENGVPKDNLVWKDTVLVPKGNTVDILVDVTNPGEWMMHCHIAEHLEAGMMALLSVAG